MLNGRLTIQSSTPVELGVGLVVNSTYYLQNSGPGEVRIGVNSLISDGYSGLRLAEGEQAEIRRTGSLFIMSNTATDLAPVRVNFLVTNR